MQLLSKEEQKVMKITGIRTATIEIPLRTPFKTALRTAYNVNDVLVCIDTDTEAKGYGEAPPTAVITGDTIPSIRDAIENYIAPALIGLNIDDLEDIEEIIDKSMIHNTSAKAAVDMAVYDLFAKSCGKPLYQILGGARRELETDLTVSVNSVDVMVRDALNAVSRGFHILKIKVGKDGREDVERLKEVRRAVGKDIVIRADANQGWTAKDAIHYIRMMEEEGVDLELVEQPVPAWDLEGMQLVTSQVHTPILADESMFSASDALKILQMHAADLLNIKLMKTGGIHQALKICTLAELYGVQCMVGCMLSSKISVSAAAHLAAGKKVVTKIDLDGPSLCRTDPYTGGPVYDSPGIIMNDTPGLGITQVPGF